MTTVGQGHTEEAVAAVLRSLRTLVPVLKLAIDAVIDVITILDNSHMLAEIRKSPGELRDSAEVIMEMAESLTLEARRLYKLADVLNGRDCP